MRLLVCFSLIIFILSGCQSFKSNSSREVGRIPSNIFYKDDRKRFPLEQFPQWGHLHKEDNFSKPWGTAFVIHSCFIATAYHVVRPTIEEITGEETVSFFSNYKELQKTPIKARPVLWGKAWEATKEGLNAEDWAVLKLETCLPEEITPLPLLSVQEQTLRSLPLIIAGFPEDQTLEEISIDYQCNAGPEPLKDDSGFGHDCATRPGNSGSPLLTIFENQAQVVGIAVAAKGYFEEIISGYSGWISNKGCPIGPLKESFEKYLKENQE